jgi:hypothetical protein
VIVTIGDYRTRSHSFVRKNELSTCGREQRAGFLDLRVLQVFTSGLGARQRVLKGEVVLDGTRVPQRVTKGFLRAPCPDHRVAERGGSHRSEDLLDGQFKHAG